MFRPIEVRALQGYRLWLRYSDGLEGEVDLSEYAGRGIFKLWDNREVFEAVYIADDRSIAWSDQLDMCPDALYLRLADRSPEEVFRNLNEMSADA